MNLILRPLIPPSALIFLKYAASVLPMTPQLEAGPLYGMMLPSFISVSVAPASYLFWAIAQVLVAANTTTVADSTCSRSRKADMIDLLDLVSVSSFLG